MRTVQNPTTPRKVAATNSVNPQAKVKAVGFVVFGVDDPYPPSPAAIVRRMVTGAEPESIPLPPCWERIRCFSTFEALREELDAEEDREHVRAALRNLRRGRVAS